MNKEFLKKLTLLYVEDQEDIKNFTTDILRSFVKEVFVAQNGLEGLEIFKKEKEKIDIIITDINMPKLDGISMIKEIKNIKDDVPVIITTAHTDEEFLKKSIKLDIHSYTLKPIDLYDLVNNIIKSLESKFLEKELIEQNSNLLEIENTKKIIDNQDSLIAVFEKNNLLYSNENFKKIFNEEFDFNNFKEEDVFFSKKKVPDNVSWYNYVKGTSKNSCISSSKP